MGQQIHHLPQPQRQQLLRWPHQSTHVTNAEEPSTTLDAGVVKIHSEGLAATLVENHIVESAIVGHRERSPKETRIFIALRFLISRLRQQQRRRQQRRQSRLPQQVRIHPYCFIIIYYNSYEQKFSRTYLPR